MFFLKNPNLKIKQNFFSFFMGGGGRGEEVGGTGVRDFFLQRMKKKGFFSGGGRVNELFLQRI